MNRYKNMLPLISGIIFMFTGFVAVATAWIAGLYRFDLRLSFSSYVGLRHSTSVMYLVSALIILTMMAYYMAKTKMLTIKKIVYSGVFICILGTALFPYTVYAGGDKNSIISSIHYVFSICLMIPGTISFILSAVLSKNKKQRTAAVLSLTYAAVFLVLFVSKFAPLYNTFFIWENVCVLLLLFGAYMERYGEEDTVSEEQKPLIYAAN